MSAVPINDGGPGFPSDEIADRATGKVLDCSQGMSLRDYFAAKAMQGLMGRSWAAQNLSPDSLFATWASSSYAVADAMLKERSAPVPAAPDLLAAANAEIAQHVAKAVTAYNRKNEGGAT